MGDYENTFNTRGDHYNKASKINSLSRNKERELLVNLLNLEINHIICDVPAGGGYLADGIADRVNNTKQIYCIEPSKIFAKGIKSDFVKYIVPVNSIPIEDDYFDRIGSLAGLHHLNDKQSFLNEASRILKPGGKIAVADVLDGTNVASFLNDSVDRFTDTGHKGMFVKEDELSFLLKSAGFVNVNEQTHNLFWEFESENELINYCKVLFGMVKASFEQVENELKKYFDIKVLTNSVRLPWTLVYASAEKN